MFSFSPFLSKIGGLLRGGGGSSEFNPNSPWMWVYIVSSGIVPLFMMYAQKFQSKVILGEISKSLMKLKTMKEGARTEAINYVKTAFKSPSASDPAAGVDRFLEYFTIMPVDLDPTGIINKLDHIMR